MNVETQAPDDGERVTGTRREFLFVATTSLVAVGGIATAWPFIDNLTPAADMIAVSRRPLTGAGPARSP